MKVLKTVLFACFVLVLSGCNSGQKKEATSKSEEKPIISFDFENGVDDWCGLYDDAKLADDAYTGKKSFLLQTNGNYNREYLSPFFDVESGKLYKISCWVKLDNFKYGNSPVNVNIRWYFDKSETCSFGGWNIFRTVPTDKGKSFDWQKAEKIIQVPEKEYMKKKIKYARIQIRNYRAKGTAMIDSISITPVTKKSTASNTNSVPGI